MKCPKPICCENVISLLFAEVVKRAVKVNCEDAEDCVTKILQVYPLQNWLVTSQY